MKELDTLLREAKATKAVIISQVKVSHRKLPNALILVVMEINCLNCNNTYIYPNIHLLLRYDRQRSKIKDWLHVYNTLPREKLIIYETSDACQECFDEDIILYTNGEDHGEIER